MRLESEDGQVFEIAIRGYQFPHLGTEPYDSNWLRVHGKVVHPRGSWTFQDPCLLTYEASALAEWLRTSGASGPLRDQMGFIEPNLEFRIVDDTSGRRLRIYFELEARPPWAPSKVAGQEDLWVEFNLAKLNLIDASQSLRDQLAAYPQRAHEGACGLTSPWSRRPRRSRPQVNGNR
jgi:hypothetical protein